MELYNHNPRTTEMPHDFQPVSLRSQHQLESHFHRTGDVILSELQKLQVEADNPKHSVDNMTPRNVFQRIRSAIDKKKIRDRFTEAKAEREFDKYSKQMESALESIGTADIAFAEVQKDVGRFFSHVN